MALRSADQLVEPTVESKHGEAAFSSDAAHKWNKCVCKMLMGFASWLA